MLTDLQKKTAQAIVNIFETGTPIGDYGRVTLLQGDSGHLTYGRSQTTLASGNLYLLIKTYCDSPQADFAPVLTPYLPRLAACDISLDSDNALRSLLREAGDDPVMQNVQDQFFDRVYWTPSVAAAEAIGVSSALGTNVVYDSKIHGSWGLIRDRTNANHSVASQIGEQTWITAYVNERRNWLANNPNTLLHRTVYRMDSFLELIGAAKWDLPLPFTVRGVLIDQNVLSAPPPARVSAHATDQRILLLQTPPMQGDDVQAVQQALAKAALAVSVDGIFGQETDTAVRQFQQQQGLKVDGIVGPATRSALGL